MASSKKSDKIVALNDVFFETKSDKFYDNLLLDALYQHITIAETNKITFNEIKINKK